MKRCGRKLTHWKQVLVYRHNGPKRVGSLRRAYFEYRQEQSMSYRCDIEGCMFHDPTSANFQNGKPIWLGAEVPLIVDHIRANTRDNRPENLRLACPNCAFQLPTHAGKNKNMKGDVGEWGYTWKVPGGRMECVYFASGGLKIGGSVKVKVRPNKNPPKK